MLWRPVRFIVPLLWCPIRSRFEQVEVREGCKYERPTSCLWVVELGGNLWPAGALKDHRRRCIVGRLRSSKDRFLWVIRNILDVLLWAGQPRPAPSPPSYCLTLCNVLWRGGRSLRLTLKDSEEHGGDEEAMKLLWNLCLVLLIFM